MKSEFYDLIYTPLDIPNIAVNRDDLLSWWDSHAQITTQFPEVGNAWITAQNGQILHPELNSIVPGIMELVKALPVNEYKITLLEQIRELPAHIDVVGTKKDPRHYVKLSQCWPCDYRVWLINDQPDDTFYFQNMENGRKLFPKWPNSLIGKPWVFNAHDRHIYHGSHKPQKGNRKIILSINTLEPPKKEEHFDLIKSSLIKYSDKALWRENLE